MGVATVGALRVDMGMNSAQFDAGVGRVIVELKNVGDAAQRAAGRASGSFQAISRHGGAASSQMMALTHSVRSVAEQMAMGVSPTQALIGQFSHLSYVIGSPGGLAFLGSIVGAISGPVIALGGIFAGLTTKINETAKTQVNFGEVFRATVEVAAGAIGEFFKPAIQQVSGWWQQFVDWISPLFKNTINFIVGFFAQGYDHAIASWQLLPQALGDLAVQAMNNVLKAIEDMLNNSRAQIVKFMADAGAALGPFGSSLLSGAAGLAGAGKISLGQLPNPYAGTASFIAGNTDYAGQFFDAISQKAQQLALSDAAAKAGKETKKTSDLLKGPLTDGIDTLTAKANAFADAITGAFSNMGTTLVDAFKKGGDVAGNVLNAILDKVGQVGESLLNSGLNALLNNAVGSLFAPVTGGAWGGGLWGSAIFGGARAAGGPVSFGTPYLVGEKGPELFVPDSSGSIMSSDRLATGPSININITGSRQDAAEIARQVSRVLPDQIAAYNRNPRRR